MSTFQPTQIAGCQLWLDAAQTNTVQTSGGFVTQWTDRSINARVFTPVSANTITTTTQNGLAALNFGANRMTNASFAWRSIFTTIIVAKSSDGAFLFSQQSGATYNRYVFTGNGSLLRVTQTSLLLADDSVIPNGTPVTASNQYFIFILGRPSGANFGSPYRINGSTRATTTTDPDIPTDGTTTNPLWINGNSSGLSSTAEVAEILFYSETLTTANCESLEGYLAWKWGLTANLPSDHPYKNYPPQFVQPNTQVILTNTNTNPGLLILPSTFTLPGLTYTFKDQVGAFSTNALTLTTNNANQTIDSLITSTINTQPLGWQSFIAGNNNRWYTVGGTLINTINASTVNTTVLRSVNISSANMFVSSLGIIDQTLRCTTQLYVQSSFLYYSFSNQSTIISGTRQSFGGLFTPIRSPFQPNQISGLQLWLDAADVNTVGLSNNTVFTWRDKSGIANNNVGSGTVTYLQNLINTMPAMNFNLNWFTGNFRTANTGTSVQIFAVLNYTNARFASRVLALAQPGANDYNDDRFCFLYRDSGTSIRIRRNAVGLTVTAPGNLTPFLVQASFIGQVATIGINGNLTPDTTNTGLLTSLNITSYAVAQNTNTADVPNGYMEGYMGEVLYYNTTLTTLQIQQIEGYLAWKWGLVSQLPAAHPYKNFPP